MIINHKYKFIYLRTRKTASASLEIALSKFCDEDDVITPISGPAGLLRRELGYPGPRNYRVPLRYYAKLDWLKLMARGPRWKTFTNHATARFVRSHVPAEVWDEYFKFAVESNPYDKAVSRYYWDSPEEPRPSLSDFLHHAKTYRLSNWDIYTINDQVVVDFVARYERLEDDLARIKDVLGLPEDLTLPRAHSDSRENRERYGTVLDSESRKRIEIVCAKEIATFGYRWAEPD